MNIISQIDSYTPDFSPSDQKYNAPPVQRFVPNRRLLRILRAKKARNTAGLSFMEKFVGTDVGDAAIAMRDALCLQNDWPGFMSFICRDAPDARGKTVTFLPNQDTMSVIHAVRLGIEAEVAVALAHQNLIQGAWIDAPSMSAPFYSDSSLLGTFSASSAPHTPRFALFARKKAANFTPAFRKEELILLTQTDEVGLFHGNAIYNLTVVQHLHCCTEAVVWGGRAEDYKLADLGAHENDNPE